MVNKHVDLGLDSELCELHYETSPNGQFLKKNKIRFLASNQRIQDVKDVLAQYTTATNEGNDDS